MENQFDSLWHGAREEITRVEQRVDYSVPSDLEVYRKYLAGESIQLREWAGDWYSMIEQATTRGVGVHRFRVFDVPLPDYQRYEIDWGYLVGTRFGQQTWAIRRPLYLDLLTKEGLSPRDFWAFDRKEFIVVNYDDKGDFVSESVSLSETEQRQLRRALEVVFKHSVSLDDFLSSTGYTPARFSSVIFD